MTQTINRNPQFKPVKDIYESRLRQFIDKDGEYRKSNLPVFYDKGRIKLDDKNQDNIIVKWYQVEFEKGSSPVNADKRPKWNEIIGNNELKWSHAFINQPFGPSWSTTWFQICLKIPNSWLECGEQLIFEWDCQNEGIVIDPEEMIPRTSFSGNGERTEYLLPKGLNEIKFYVECGNNGMFGCGDSSLIGPPNNERYFHLIKADLVWPNWNAHALYIDFWMLGDAARELPDNCWQKHRARQLGNIVMNIFNDQDPESIVKCRELLHKEFFDDFSDCEKVYHQGDKEVKTNVFAIGNCHIDSAWLWPFAETKRKVIRSWSSQCTLMDSFPEYRFVASQAQQFKWLLNDHPVFFEKILQEKVQQSQFFPIGGSWVENDTNIPSGESLCRQFFFGQRFFLKHFGKKSNIFWLPDTFGYSSQIPQLCQISGISRFLTQKLSWNNINDFPHSTFNWCGIDGSQILTHMPPGNTYTASAHFGDVLRTAHQNKNNETYGSGILLYGIGDGGGGPTREMLEKMRRIRSMSNRNGNIIPKLQVGNTVDDFYEDILKNTDNGNDLPTWCGELYFEFHRGTYTTQSLVKKLMRSSEVKIHDVEWLATKTSILFPDEYQYPIDKINSIWENILLCQFHDVLPGSCIEMVYKYEAIPMLEAGIKECHQLIDEVLKVLNKYGNPVPVSTLQWNSHLNIDIEPSLYSSSVKENKTVILLSNNKLEVTISKLTGSITNVKDLEYDLEYLDLVNGRNKLGANQFVLFDDKPLNWQAWDTELYSVNQYKYLENVRSVTIVKDTPKICSVKVIIDISESCSIISTISLKSTDLNIRDEAKIDIITQVNNWNLTNKFLKVEFPVNIYNDFASYETQFGITKRPTHYNTSWDVAKFEVCQHKFADYSDFSKGVSILNDCKYGFSTHGNLMRLSLLRSSKAPDAHADMGSHEIKYSIYPHKGQLSSKTVKLGIEFNYSHKYYVSSSISKKFNELITIMGDDNIILSNIKKGEDDSNLSSEYCIKHKDRNSIIVRVYESLGGEGRATLFTFLPLQAVYKIDNLELEIYENVEFKILMERNSKKYHIPIRLRQFEVSTFMLVF